MDSLNLTAVVLGIVEGLTEFLPVSSTGHLVLATDLFGYDLKDWEVFNIVIQLPAIMAVVVVYWRTFVDVAHGALRRERESLHFIRNVLIAFIPSAVLGVLLKKKIDLLLESPSVVAVALIVGGVAIIVIERLARQRAYEPVSALPVRRSFLIGVVQCIAMIPGVSRSGATIMGALAMGENRKTAAEFSFFLAVPTMFGATAKQLWDNRHALAAHSSPIGFTQIAIGSVVSFVVSLVVIRLFIGYISRHGFIPFAIYRILAGSFALYWLLRA
ncbi:undecaprenyl-diphosphate phosphatase [Novosphingobium sp. Fuku2-ISO-50]|jgi:undecaprenyl-diphosphatase|uniref:undecaprenyl-diphosphate phosphatase n=1 Tax=Novosphingobium sp. Fuku2-ISO-50 TaxID=1739114 RepID=UPI00076C9B0B|nr:undecaprenyl-diphosphate phosphatase [Novosphingobium sp. Fuku2-ISO-50]KUR76529.1 UDP-diphosphatase [Novosphingobium sp. Fuku2-ISO-50]